MVNELTALLQQLIAIPSFSKQEEQTAMLIQSFLKEKGCTVHRKGNNVWTYNMHFDANKPSLLLNSHHDTVKANSGYTRDAFLPTIEDGKLYGLGSNDAGGALVCLLGAFLHFKDRTDLPFNLIYAATAEEEISGVNGIESIIQDLPNVQLAIVGEPTLLQIAVAERGLLVLDCTSSGKAGHAARNEGVNAIYRAMEDINWFGTYQFPKQSPWLGKVSMNVTMINAGTAHNQVPAACSFVVDIRLNDCYTHAEVLEIIRANVQCEIKERSTRIKPSFIEVEHPMIKAAQSIGITFYGSPTTSDMALMPWKAVKIGPGDSARSHSADEFIYLKELEDGLATYIQLIETYSQQVN